MKKSYAALDSHVAHASKSPAESSSSDVDDMRVLPPYTGDDQTLVGLGPPSSRSPVVLPASPLASLRPQSEPPGPWGSDEEADALPPSLLGRKGGIWAAAVPLLVVFAVGTVFALRGLAPRVHPAAVSASAGSADVHGNTGLFVRLTNPDVRVTIDGQDHGPPPVLLMGMAPGSHVLTISGPGYTPYEQPVTLTANNVSTLEPTLLKSDAASADASHGAGEVTVPDAPDIDALAAAKSGAPHALSRGVRPTRVELEETPPNPYTELLEAQGGLLAASSSPPAMVVVDGRPEGKSPRAVELPPGVHTVTFIHPELGRRSLTVNITPGKTSNAAAEF